MDGIWFETFKNLRQKTQISDDEDSSCEELYELSCKFIKDSVKTIGQQHRNAEQNEALKMIFEDALKRLDDK